MVQQIPLSDGSIAEFPDEMGEDQIAEALGREFPAGQNTQNAPAVREGQQGQGTDVSAGSDTDDTADPFPNVPIEINGVVLTDELREAIQIGRGIEDPKQKRIMAARIAGRIAFMSEGGNFADDILRGQVGSGIRAFANGIFGLGDATAASVQALKSDISFGDALEVQREFRRAQEEEFPITTGISELAGAVVGVGGILGAGRASVVVATNVGGRTSQIANAGSKIFGFGKGQKFKNVLRASGGGAAFGGASEFTLEGGEGAVVGASFGAVGGPLGLGLARAANIGVQAIKNFRNAPVSRSIKILAKKLGETEDEMARRWLEFKAVTGRPPSIADISNAQAAAELRVMIGNRTSSTAIAEEAAEKATVQRSGQVAEELTGGRVTTTQAQQKATRNSIAKKQFAKADKDLIEFTGEEVTNLLSDPDMRRALPPSLKRRIDAILEGVEEGEGATLTGLDVNDIRLALRDRGKGATGADRIFIELANDVEDIARRQSKNFARAIDEFFARSTRGEGVVAGQKILSAKTSEFEAAVNLSGDAQFVASKRVGARSALGDKARESSGAAIGLSRALSEDGGLIQRLRSVLPKREVDRLQKVAELETRSARNVSLIAPGVRAEGDEAAQAVIRDAINATVVAMGNTGGAFKASAIFAVLKRIRPSFRKKTLESLARDAFDPDKVSDVIAAMRRMRLGPAEILDVYASAAIAARELASTAIVGNSDLQ